MRVAIIGIGAIAEIHARALGDVPSVELVSACCRTEEKGLLFSENHGCSWYPDAARMIRREKPDAVTIATPSGAHLELALKAIRKGVHVKKILFLLLSISILSCSGEKNTPNPNKGIKAKTISEYKAGVKFGETVWQFLRKEIRIYNSNGNEVERSYYEDGTLDYKQIYEYDSDGNEIKRSNYDKDGTIEGHTYIGKYDSDGNQVEWLDYRLDESLATITLKKYNSNGNMVEDSFNSSDGTVLGKSIYKYDSFGNNIEELNHGKHEKYSGKTIRKYDSNSNLVEELDYYKDGTLQSKIINKYDSNGNMVEDSYYTPGSQLVQKNTTKYNSKNRPIEMMASRYEYKFGDYQEIPTEKTTYEYELY